MFTGLQYDDSSELCEGTMGNQEDAVCYQNAHLGRNQVNVNKLAMIENLPSREALAKVLQRGSLEDEFIHLGRNGEYNIRVEVSPCEATWV